jgi:protein ImuB
MSRIVSIWLRNWPIARLLLAQAKSSGAPADAVDPHRPLVLVVPGPGGARLTARNRAARMSGLADGELLSNARSKVAGLQARDADPAADDAALRKLALWAQRYTPIVAPWGTANGSDGLFLDIAGAAHLFGGEAQLLADLAQRLARFHLTPRLAIADHPGTAWALARYGATDRAIVPPGEQASALRDLPIAALRLPEETRALLHRLGLRRIGELIDRPRAPFASRFGAHLLLRLDQALGRAPEPLKPLVPPPLYRTQAVFAEPISSEEHVVEAARRLLVDLVPDLARDGVGARRLRLMLFRVDGEVLSLDLGLAAPSRDGAHMAQLIALRLDRLPHGLEADFGFDAAAVQVRVAEPMPERQAALAAAHNETEGLARLVDRLGQHLGADAVRVLQPQQSHIPERAVSVRRAIDGTTSEWARSEPDKARPLSLLPRPEAIDDVMALIPEGPPRRFRWHGVLHRVMHAEGPERIEPEWWRQGEAQRARDYYVVEDAAGRRFWLYRAGLYRDGEAEPRWFVHGVFA